MVESIRGGLQGWVLLFAGVLAACGGNRVAHDTGRSTGSERGPCYGNGTCDEGLTCASDTCVRVPDGGGDRGSGGRTGSGGASGNTGGFTSEGGVREGGVRPEGGVRVEGGVGCDPLNVLGCLATAPPCRNFVTGFGGDEFCIEPPDPSLGFQLHVGPDDYDDPVEVDPYLVLPGDEVRWAEFVVTPNDATIFTRGYSSRMRPASRRFILFGVSELPSDAGISPPTGTVGGDFLGGSTRAVQDADTGSPYPEDQGIGAEMPPHRPIAVNLHSINTSDAPLLQEIWVNFILLPEEEIIQFAKPITWYGGLGMAIAPGTAAVLKNSSNSCMAPNDLRILDMSGEVHANSVRITASTTRANGDSQILFEDYDWASLGTWRFTPAIANPAPDAATKRSGAYSGLLDVHPGDAFSWECEIANTSNVTLTYNNRLYDGEMCNVYGQFATPNRDRSGLLCAFF